MTSKDGEKEKPTPPARVFHGFTLNRFQQAAVEAVDRERSVLVSAPTGAGKTLVAEYAVERVLMTGGRAIYTAPIKALSNQKYRDFRDAFKDRVGIMTGDITLNPEAPLLIMTTEIFRNTIFEDPGGLDDVKYVVFDEIHYMDDPERGTVWEESIIFAPPHIRFICLSATVSNLKQFGDWISKVRGEEIEMIRSRDRPVPLKHYLFLPGRGPVQSGKAGRITRPKKGARPTGVHAEVVHFLRRYRKLPALFFCFSRKECEKRALESQRLRLLTAEEQGKMERLLDEIIALYGLKPDAALTELKRLALHGVGFHHAGLLPQHKELVERLFTSGLIKLLFTTETFALGINMPARTVVFSSLRKFDGVGFDIMTTREYQQMAGRAGRQGIDTEGLVYAVFEDRRTRVEQVKKLISNDVEPVQSRFNLSYSSLINLHAHLGDRIYEAWERSFNNFQWARMSRKKREQNQRKQVSLIEKKLALLQALDYIEPAGLRPKGQVAALINGYELQAVEFLFSGLLEWMSETEINIALCAVVFEERPGDLYRALDPGRMGTVRRDVLACVEEVVAHEKEQGIPGTLRIPDFKIASVAAAWCDGASLNDLRDLTNASQGDLIRTFRLAIQLLRQIRKAMPSNPDLSEKLKRCIVLMNRDEADALRQLRV